MVFLAHQETSEKILQHMRNSDDHIHILYHLLHERVCEMLYLFLSIGYLFQIIQKMPFFTVFINDEFVIEYPLWDDGAPEPDLDDDPAFLFTEVEPQFPGGLDAMNEYLVKEVKFAISLMVISLKLIVL